MVTTEEFLTILSVAWKWLKKTGKFIVETHFTCWEDVIYFCALYGGFITILVTFTLSAFNMGYDQGETDGLKRGFANGATYMGSTLFKDGYK